MRVRSDIAHDALGLYLSAAMTIKIGPEVAIVILNWNGSTDTIDCIRSLTESDAAGYCLSRRNEGCFVIQSRP